MSRTHWTPRMDATLRAVYPDQPTAHVAEILGLRVPQVYNRAHHLHLKKSPAFHAADASTRIKRGIAPGAVRNQFKKGNIPFNKGLRRPPGWAPGRMAETQFKKGEMHGAAQHNYVPVGTEKIETKNGYLLRKVTDDHPVPARRWIAVHRLVWIAENGPIPAAHKVAFKDGMRTNIKAEITLDKLQLISNADNMRRNCHHNNYPKDVCRAIQARGALQRMINKRTKQA